MYFLFMKLLRNSFLTIFNCFISVPAREPLPDIKYCRKMSRDVKNRFETLKSFQCPD